MKHLFLINPAAGSFDRSRQTAEEIRRVFAGQDFEISISAAPGDCRRMARAAAQTGQELRIYACGGDGTLNEVAAGAAGFPNAAVTAYCCGSGNDFVKIFSEPDAFRDLSRFLEAETAEFDMIRCNDDLGLNIVSVGLDARIGTDVSRYKRIPLLSGFRAYAVSTVVNVIRGIGEHYTVEVDGQVIDGNQTLICACNGRFYGGGFNPVPDADPTDGLLDVLIVEQVSRLQVPGVIGRYKDGRFRELPQLVRHFRTPSLRITCDAPTAINLDGELRGAEVIDLSIAQEKLRFFYPKGLSFMPQ